jgi:hypothetical protein
VQSYEDVALLARGGDLRPRDLDVVRRGFEYRSQEGRVLIEVAFVTHPPASHEEQPAPLSSQLKLGAVEGVREGRRSRLHVLDRAQPTSRTSQCSQKPVGSAERRVAQAICARYPPARRGPSTPRISGKRGKVSCVVLEAGVCDATAVLGRESDDVRKLEEPIPELTHFVGDDDHLGRWVWPGGPAHLTVNPTPDRRLQEPFVSAQ